MQPMATSVSDLNDVFKAYTALYAYDKAELNAQVEETTQMGNWTREKITFDAAYGHERVRSERCLQGLYRAVRLRQSGAKCAGGRNDADGELDTRENNFRCSLWPRACQI